MPFYYFGIMKVYRLYCFTVLVLLISCKKETLEQNDNVRSVTGVWDERKAVLNYYDSGLIIHSDTVLFEEAENRYHFKENEVLVFESNESGSVFLDTLRYEYFGNKLVLHLNDGPDTSTVRFITDTHFQTVLIPIGTFTDSDSSGTIITTDFYNIQ